MKNATMEAPIKVDDKSWTCLNCPVKELEPHGDLIDRKAAIERFSKLSWAYDFALQDCDLEKEVYPHYAALMRGKKAVIDMVIKIMNDLPVVVESSGKCETDVSKRVTFKEANANLMNVNSLSVSECLEVFGIESQAGLCLNCVHNTECVARRFYCDPICTCRFFIPVRCDKK